MSDDPAYGRTTPAPEPSGPPAYGRQPAEPPAYGQQPSYGQQPAWGPGVDGQPSYGPQSTAYGQVPAGQAPDGPPAYGQAPDGPPAYGPPVQGPPSAYGQPWDQPAAARTNVLAILSLVFAFVFSPLGIVLGFVARKQTRERGEGGRGLATAGIVVGFALLLVGLLIAVGIAVLFHAASSDSGTSSSSGAVVLGALALLR